MPFDLLEHPEGAVNDASSWLAQYWETSNRRNQKKVPRRHFTTSDARERFRNDRNVLGRRTFDRRIRGTEIANLPVGGR